MDRSRKHHFTIRIILILVVAGFTPGSLPNTFAGYIAIKKTPCPNQPTDICTVPVEKADPHSHTLYEILLKNQWPTSLAYCEVAQSLG